jgi:hypothetical protein
VNRSSSNRGLPPRYAAPRRRAALLRLALAAGLACAFAVQSRAEPTGKADLDGAVYLAPAHPDYFPVALRVRLEVRDNRLYGLARPAHRPGAPERQILADFVEERGEFVLGRLYASARERQFRARIWQRDERLLVRVYDDYNYRTLEFQPAP